MLSIVTWVLRGLGNGRQLYFTSLIACKMIGLLNICRGQEGEKFQKFLIVRTPAQVNWVRVEVVSTKSIFNEAVPEVGNVFIVNIYFDTL